MLKAMERLGTVTAPALALVALVGCGSDFGNSSTAATQDGGNGAESGAGTSDGGADGAGANADSGPAPEPCAKIGDVRYCKAASGEGAQTCLEQPDHSLVWGKCVPAACDASAQPGAEEVCVPAGQFTMGGLDGSDGTNPEYDTLPAHTVTIRRRFYFDKYEVTYDEFMAWFQPTPTVPPDNTLVYVSGTGDALRWHGTANVKAPGTDASGLGCTAGVVANDPSKKTASINCLTWETALAYCVAHRKRLPTEAEWEYVATGMGANSAFPWGAAVPDSTCKLSIDHDCYQNNKSQFPFTRPSAVQGNTKNGINNLAGNEAEWTLDLAPPNGCTADQSCWPAGASDPLNVKDNQTGYSLRGGSWLSTADAVRARSRGTLASPTQQGGAGFRCVRDDF